MHIFSLFGFITFFSAIAFSAFMVVKHYSLRALASEMHAKLLLAEQTIPVHFEYTRAAVTSVIDKASKYFGTARL